MAKILLVDADSKGLVGKYEFKILNLALSKISAWHKAQGDEVFLNACANPDQVYVSCVFTWNRGKTLFYPEAKMGGTGIDLTTELPYEIEHIMPDYSLYGVNYSMGFTSRGCIRQCPFCLVPRKEGLIRDHARLAEFIYPDHKKVMLLDNNLLAAPRAKETLQELADRKLKVCFTQGLDIRLVTDKNAALLAACDYRSLSFKERRLYFAFDDPDLESVIMRGIERLDAAGIKRSHLMFYVLCGFNTSFEEDLHRVNLLNELGVDPFVMKYNNSQDPMLNKLARWSNIPPIRKTIPFSKYTRQKVRHHD